MLQENNILKQENNVLKQQVKSCENIIAEHVRQGEIYKKLLDERMLEIAVNKNSLLLSRNLVEAQQKIIDEAGQSLSKANKLIIKQQYTIASWVTRQ